MKRKYTRRIIWTTIFGIVLTTSFVLFYWPFVQMEDIDAENYFGSCLDDSWHDKGLELKLRLELYPSCWFIHKGDVYSDIPFHYGNSAPLTVDIRFNWDNSITVSKDAYRYDLHVDSVVLKSELFPFKPQSYPDVYDPDDYYPLKHHETDDSLFAGAFFYDKNKNEITIYRQKSMIPYGGRRVGFYIRIDGKEYLTGKESPFDY